MKKGIYLVLITTLISGLANFFNKFAMQALGKDAFQYTFLKNGLVAIIISVVIVGLMVLPKLKKMSYSDWFKLLLIGLVGGGIPFLLFFKGLSLTSAVSASFIHKTLFVWVALLALPLLKEKISGLQFIALGVLLLGNIIFESFKGLSWGMGETLILFATLFWAIETILAKKMLQTIDPLILAWARMFFGSCFIIVFLAATNNIAGTFNLNLQQMPWLLLVSLFLMGYIITWYSALKKLPANVVSSILVLASPITTILNSVFVSHKILSLEKFYGLIIIVSCLLVFIFASQYKDKKSENSI